MLELHEELDLTLTQKVFASRLITDVIPNGYFAIITIKSPKLIILP